MKQQLPLHPTKRHPHTGAPLRAIFVRRDGRIFWPIMGGDDTVPTAEEKAAADAAATAAADKAAADKAAADAAAAGADDGPKKGEVGYFPPNTPKADMTPAEQLAYDAHHGRKHEDRNKAWQKTLNGKTAEQVAADLKELETLRTASLSDGEKAVNQAKLDGRREASLALAPQMFDVAMSHVDEDRRKVLIDSLDLSKVIKEDGTIDTDKVTSIAKTLAPAKGQEDPDYGNGKRTAHTSSGVGAGRDRYRERHNKTGKDS